METNESPQVRRLNRVKEAMRAAHHIRSSKVVSEPELIHARVGANAVIDRYCDDVARDVAEGIKDVINVKQARHPNGLGVECSMGVYVFTEEQFQELAAAVADFTWPKHRD